MLKNSFIVVGLAVLLSACGEQLIKPQDKHVEAMVEFQMPDYEATTKNVAKKLEKWMLANRDIKGGKVTYMKTNPDEVKGRGVVTFNVRNEDLSVKFDIMIDVVSPNLVKFDSMNYQDMPGPRQGESDRAYVFYNQVKDHVLEIVEDLEDYMNEDTQAEPSLLDAVL